jgi:hypothetical protein
MQRTLYTFSMAAEFHTTLNTVPRLWPDCINGLRQMFQNTVTADLVIPTMGTFKATIVSWDQETNASITSGERVEIRFLEEYVSEQLIGISSFTEIGFAYKDWVVAKEKLPRKPTILDEIDKYANKVLGFRDQVLLFREGLVNTIDSFTALIGEADETLALLDDPQNDPVLQAMQRLWLAAIKLAQAPGEETSTEQRIFVTDRTMTASEASARIYQGDSSRAYEVMALNYLEDPLAIPAGTRLIYLKSVAVQ